MKKTGRLNVICPECGGELVVDAISGEVLIHKAAKKPIAGGMDFDTLLAGVNSSKSKAAEIFDRELSSLDDRGRLLEAKFEEAMARAQEEDDDTPPVRPWDLE